MIVAGIGQAPPVVAAVEPIPPVIITEAVAASPAAPNALAVFDVSVRNDGELAAGTPLTLALTAPSGVGIESIVSSDPDVTWECASGLPAATCELHDATTGTPIALEDLDAADARVTVELAGTVVVGAGLAIGIAADVPAVGGVEPDLSLASTTVTLLPPPARQELAILVDDDLPAEVVRATTSTSTTTIRNLGPARLGGARSPVVVTAPVPPGATNASTSSSGWSCRTRRGQLECTWNGAEIAVGGSVPSLTVTYTAPSEVTPVDGLLVWTREVSATPAGRGRPTVVSSEQTISVGLPGQPDVSLAASLASPAVFEAPASVEVDLTVTGRNLLDPMNTVFVVADVPTGFTYSSVDSTDPWVCGQDGALVQCTRPADFGGESSSVLTLGLEVAADAAVGPGQLGLYAAVPGEPDDLQVDNGAQIDVQVVERPTAATRFRLFSYPDGGPAEPTDGSPYGLLAGVATSIGLDAVNNGNSPIPVGTEFTLGLELPVGSTVTTTTDAGTPDWACTTQSIGDTPVVECTLTTTEAIALDAELPRLKADVTATSGAVAGPTTIAATLTGAEAGAAQPALASSIDIDALVIQPEDAAPESLTVTTTVGVTPRIDGRSGSFSIAVANDTEEWAPGVSVGVALPQGLQVVHPVPDGCLTGLVANWLEFDLVCFRLLPIPPGGSKAPIDISVRAVDGAVNPSTVDVSVTPISLPIDTVSAPFDLTVLPGLDAVATATPSSVVGQPFGLPQQAVLLDGRSSVTLGADVTWRQVPVGGEPIVTFDGVDPGVATVNAPTASFTAPIVAEPTILHFEFSVSDGVTTSVATVAVDVAPIPIVPPGGETGWETVSSAPPAGPTGFRAVAPAALAPGEPGWVWATDPSVSPNDLGDGSTTPVRGSRARLLDNGVFVWNGAPDPAPTDVIVSHQFFECDPGDPTACTSFSPLSTSVPDAAIPDDNGADAVLRMTVNGLVNGVPIETVQDFALGTIGINYGTPAVLVPPSTSGAAAVGQELTAEPGEWTLEFDKAYEWLRCAAPATLPTDDASSCTAIAGADQPTYSVGIADIGTYLRARVTAFGLEGAQEVALSSSTAVVPDNGAGWAWSVAPAVRLNDLNDPAYPGPIEPSRMTLLDNGTFAWTGTSLPPSVVVASHQWLTCDDPADPATCFPLGVETSVVPDAVIPLADGGYAVLRMIVRGNADGALVETIQDFPLGPIDNANRLSLTPVALVAPSISGTEEIGQVLTADPGQWTLEFDQNYEWLRCTQPAALPTEDASSCSPIAGGFDPTYTVSRDDVDFYLRVRVNVSGGESGVGEALSASTAAIPDDGFGNPLEVTTDLPGGIASIPNSGQLTITGAVTGGQPPIALQWTQTGGTSVLPGPIDGAELTFTAPATGTGDLEFTLTATDQAPNSATAVVTVTYGAVAVPGVLCEVLNGAEAATGPVSIELNDSPKIELTFDDVTINSAGGCSDSTTLTMTGASLNLFDWMLVENLQVDIDVDGVEVTGGMLTFPGDDTLSGMNFRVITDGLSIPFNLDGADLQIAGSVIADSLPFLGLPSGWDAGAKVSLTSAGGVQTIGFEAIAWDTDDGAATTSPDALPVPPSGAATLALTGSASTDRTFSFGVSATDLVRFGESGLDFTGSVARATSGGPTVITASASLSSPVTLTPGLTLDEAALGWDGQRFTGSGALGISTNGGTLALTAAFDFADPKDFSASLTLETGSGTPSWTPVNGLTITQPQVIASITRLGASTTIDLTVSAARVDIGADVALIDPTFELGAACNPRCQPPAFSLSGDVEVDVGNGPPAAAAFAGSLDLATGAFEIDASIANLTPFDGLTLNSLDLSISGGAGQPLSIVLTADATVLGVQSTVTISFDDQGFFVAVTLGNWNPGSGSPTFNGAQVVYSSYATSVDVGGQSVLVPARTVLVTGTTSAPQWFTDLIGYNIGQLTVVGSIDLSNADFRVEITFDLPPTELFSVGGVTLDIDDVAFLVERIGGSITTGLSSNGTLTVPNSSGSGSSELPIRFAAAFSSTAVLTGSITLLGDWNDAFGVTDLTVRDLTVQVSISLSSAGGSFGFAGTVILPPSWGNEIGVVSGTPIKLVASVGTADPCFGIEVGDPGSTTTVLDVASAGALTAKYLSIVIAPRGCRVGLEQLPPGLSLYFDGAVLGVDVLVKASVTPTPFTLSADITIGTVQISGFNLDGAHIKIDVTPIKRAVEFEASASIFGVTADVAGAFSKTVTGTRASFSGVVTTPDLGGFELEELAVSFDFVQAGPIRTLSAAASASVRVLGAPQFVSFSFVFQNGRIVEASGNANINIPLDKLTITGSGSFRFVAGQFPEISITGQVDADGRSLTSMSGTLTGGGLTLSATLGTASGFSSAPKLSGTVAWRSDGTSTITIVDQNGVTRTAAPGDFRFDARNVGLEVSGFGLNVDVTIGKVGSTFWATFDSSIDLGAAGGIAVGGSFASNGDFSLTGSAALSLGGFTLPSGTISVSKAGQTLSVSGDITYSVPKLTSVRFRGSFVRSPQVGLLYDLSGSAVVRPGGYDFGNGTFHLYRRSNGTTGLNADVTVNIPGFASGAASVAITPTQLSFSVNLRMQDEIGAVLGYPTASLSYQNGPQRVPTGFAFNPFRVTYATVNVDVLAFSVTASRVLKIPGSVAVTGIVSGSNFYSFTVTAAAGPYSKSKKVGVCKATVSASGNFDGTITGTANSLSIKIDADLSGSAKCGTLKASIKTEVTFRYTFSAQFSIKVRIVLNFGSGVKWKPTVLDV